MRVSRHVLHPAGFHGQGMPRARGRSYFEGWYCKLVSGDHSTRLAVIPGVYTSAAGDVREAFVQVLDGSSRQATYHAFDPRDFAADPLRFDVRVGRNRFSDEGMHLELPECEGEVSYVGPLARWPVTPLAPGAMGWYAWLPTMQCYHGVISLDHRLAGSLTHHGQTADFTDGRGYLEKDWGQTFPQSYLWVQSNHFELPGASFVLSIALIPWRGRAFRGFIAALRLPPGNPGAGLHRMATYTRAHTLHLAADSRGAQWVGRAPDGRELWVTAHSGQPAGVLYAPIRTQMHQRVAESLSAELSVELRDTQGALLFSGHGVCGGYEAHGPLDELLASQDK